MPNSDSDSSNGRLEAAEKRIHAANDRLDRTKKLADKVLPRANGVIEASKIRLRAAASQGARSKIPELLAQHTIAAIGTWSYALICGIGLAYSLGFYRRIVGIRIFDYFDTPDFLLSAFGNPLVPAIGLVVGVLSVIALVFRYYRRSVQLANFHWTTGWDTTVRRKNYHADRALIAMVITATFGIPYIAGELASKNALHDKSRLVQVSLLQKSDKPSTRIPKADHTILLGTTSNFHLFYECESPLLRDGAKPCESWKPFVAPRANVASIAFDLNEANPVVTDSDMVVAISKLTTAINELDLGKEIIVDTSSIANALADLKETIGNLELNALLDINNLQFPPQFAALPRALANTGTAIELLNETISSLGFPDTGDSCVSSFGRIGSVGPFSVGEHLSDQQNEDSLNAGIIALNSSLVRNTPIHLLFVGRVDITPLTEGRDETYYGSNLGLAQARATWVRNQLLEIANTEEYRDVLNRALLLSAGPMNVGEETDESDRQKDRRVDVWGCWKES